MPRNRSPHDGQGHKAKRSPSVTVKRNALYAARAQAAEKTLTELFKTAGWDPIEAARKPIDSEIKASPEAVGPPITILAVGNRGTFVDPKENGCPIVVEPTK